MLTINNMPRMIPIPLGDGADSSWWQSIKDWRKNHRRFLIYEDWYYTLPNGSRIIIPKGFVFDGASVPRFLWPILDPFGVLLLAGLIHDFGYRYDFLVDAKSSKPIMVGKGRAHWDNIFQDVAKKTNGLFITNKSAHRALRIFGGIAWKVNRTRNAPVYWSSDGRTVEDIWSEVLDSTDPFVYLASGCPRDNYIATYGV